MGYTEFTVTSADTKRSEDQGKFRYAGKKSSFERYSSQNIMWQLDGRPIDIIERIQSLSANLRNPYIAQDTEYGTYYGERDHDILLMTGWEVISDVKTIERLKETLERVREREAREQSERDTQNRQRAEREIARLRAQFPDLA